MDQGFAQVLRRALRAHRPLLQISVHDKWLSGRPWFLQYLQARLSSLRRHPDHSAGSGVREKKTDDAKFFILLLESSLKPALIGVKEFLGHDSQVHGGTVGDPNAAGVCPPINKRPLVSCSEQLGILFCPPWSKVEKRARAVTDYVWRAGVDRDIKNTGRLTRTLLTECESKQALRATQSMMRNHCVEEADLHANEASQQGPGRGRYHFGRSLLCHHIDQSSKTCVGAPLMDKV